MSETTNAPRSKHQALAWLVQNSPVTAASYRELGEVFGWDKTKAWKVIQAWKRKGYVETETAPDTGRLTVTIVPTAIPIAVANGVDDDDGDGVPHSERETSSPLPSVTDDRSQPTVTRGNGRNISERPTSEPAIDTVYASYVSRPREAARGETMTALDVLAILAALSLTGVAAWLSVHGFVVLFPGLPIVGLWLGCSLEGAKVVMAAWLGARWRDISWLSRVVLLVFTAGAAGLNASGVYSQLVQAHVSPRGAASAGRETSDAEAAARIELAQQRIADLEKRLGQIDGAVAEATKRGRTKGAMQLAEDQRRARGALAGERDRAAQELAGLKAQRAGAAAQGRAEESEAAPIAYLAELLNISRGGEELIRWVIAGVVACTDPFALAILAALSSRRRRWA